MWCGAHEIITKMWYSVVRRNKMLKRKFDEFLINWKNKAEEKPLIVTGARQVGKTTSIEEFGKTYKSFIEINFVSPAEIQANPRIWL